MSASTPPGGTGAPASAGRGPYGLCVTAIVRNEASYIEEWLAFHVAVGVDHFFIFDNRSTDNLADVLTPWINHGLVTLLYWPLTAGQLDAYNFALSHFGHRTEWMAFIDLDEFVLPKAHPTLPAFVASLGAVDQVLIPWRNFSYSGHRTRPPGFVIENYTIAEDVTPERFPTLHAKAIVRTSAAEQMIEVHVGKTRSGNTVNEKGQRVPEECWVAAPSFELIQLNHYYTKSYEEMEAKVRRGSATGGGHKTLLSFDRPGFTTPETAILSRIEDLRRVLDKVHRLPPDPFSYGTLQKRLPFAPRDALGWLQRLTLSNHLNRTPYVSLGIPLKFHNLSGNKSHVVRAADHGWTAAPGALEACIHVRDLLRRLRARTEWALGDGSLDGLAAQGALLSRTPEGELLVEQRGEAPSSLVFPTDPGPLRRRTFFFAVTTPSRMDIDVETQGSAEQLPQTCRRRIQLPEAGTFLVIIEIDPRPASVVSAAITLSPSAGRVVRFQDLMLAAYA
jgi:hypothetical protein